MGSEYISAGPVLGHPIVLRIILSMLIQYHPLCCPAPAFFLPRFHFWHSAASHFYFSVSGAAQKQMDGEISTPPPNFHIQSTSRAAFMSTYKQQDAWYLLF